MQENKTISNNMHKMGRCERTVNGNPLIGDDITLTNENNQAILRTEAFNKKAKTMCDHRNRIK